MINKVHMLRKQHKITQEALANMVGVTRQNIISIENGKYQASLLLALKIARVFEMPVEEVFIVEESD